MDKVMFSKSKVKLTKGNGLFVKLSQKAGSKVLEGKLLKVRFFIDRLEPRLWESVLVFDSKNRCKILKGGRGCAWVGEDDIEYFSDA